jgi:hypothetical protein
MAINVNAGGALFSSLFVRRICKKLARLDLSRTQNVPPWRFRHSFA